MYFTAANTLKRFPFARLLCALIAGIVLQWYLHLSTQFVLIFFTVDIFLLIGFSFLPAAKKFTFNWLRSMAIFIVLIITGMLLVEKQNIKNDAHWYGNFLKPGNLFVATVEEPPVEKNKSLKALVSINAIFEKNKWMPTKGKAIFYFKKDSAALHLHYGSQLLSKKNLLTVQNSGNPGALDYTRFCLFQGITHQVFISQSEYLILSSTSKNIISEFLFDMRNGALKILQQNIHSSKALGIAEALLIGYRNDLDKDLVQAYSDTGVVHIIAISGMHIAIIYGSLLWLFSLLKPFKGKKWIEAVVILAIIWMFTLIAGAAPSILRATVMSTFLMIGRLLNKNAIAINTLAASAFLILVFNPFNLWDVGFQLSYAAVLSILLFYKPVSSLVFTHNQSLLDLWKLAALSLSAQIFAIPVVIYHFHQFPTLFLVSNLLAVPLSSLILYAELLLFAFAFWQPAASVIGFIIEKLIDFLNNFIQYLNDFRFTVFDGLSITKWQLALMYFAIVCVCVWLLYKNNKFFTAALIAALLFFVLRDVNILAYRQQQKIIVYNISSHNAIDFVSGNNFLFEGDSAILTDAALRNYDLKPSRIKQRLSVSNNKLIPGVKNLILNFNGRRILLLNSSFSIYNNTTRIPVDIIIINGKIKNTIAQLSACFNCKTFIASGKTSNYKCMQWKKDCELLHLRFRSVAQSGSAIINVAGKI